MNNFIFNLSMFYCNTLQWILNNVPWSLNKLPLVKRIVSAGHDHIGNIYLHYHQEETDTDE